MDEFTHYHDTEMWLPRELCDSIISVLGRACSLSLMMALKDQKEMDAFRERVLEFPQESLRLSNQEFQIMRVKAFGSSAYQAKSPDEYRRLFYAGLKHCVEILEKQ